MHYTMVKKRILPKSLFVRFLLIILIPNIIVQAVSIYMFYERHWNGVSKHMTVALAGDIEMVVKAAQIADHDQRHHFIHIAKHTLYLQIGFVKGGKIITVHNNSPVSDFESLDSELKDRISLPYTIYYASQDNSDVSMDVQFPEGILRIIFSDKRLANPSTYIFILWMTGTAILLAFISIIFMRNQVKSIKRLAIVAEKLGKGQEIGIYNPEGAAEVRTAGKAFIDMHERIKKQVEQRTQMLAGVSHDLKTPITRIKLQLALMKDSQAIKELHEDVTEMEKMVNDYIDFAKGKGNSLSIEIELSSFITSVAFGYKNDNRIELDLRQPANILINPNNFKRVITNIIDNSLRYASKVKITSQVSGSNVIIYIDDNGPGIPAHEREAVFKPFYRLDTSRNLQTGGTGLGLAIARDIITSYGGEISLDESLMGGVCAIIKLPI